MSSQIMSLWGKARGTDQPHPTHPLAYHSLDVAAVAEQALITDSILREKIDTKFKNVGADKWIDALVALIAAHDLGKCSPHFQFNPNVPNAHPIDAMKAPASVMAYDHAWGSKRLMLEGAAGELRGASSVEAWTYLASASATHHGVPVVRFGQHDNSIEVNGAQPYASDLFAELNAVVNPHNKALPEISVKNAKQLSWVISGLTIAADWIGSNTDFFPYTAPTLSLADYWQEAREKARKGLIACGLNRPQVNQVASWKTLFPGWSPSPVQEFCETVSIPDGPALFIIEDVMGAGKTEAAIALAARMMRKQNSRGLVIGLPTMATANALYGRMAQHYRDLFLKTAQPSLALAHGRAKLNADFRSSVWPGNGPAQCRKFFADNRAATSLADVAVATIDQLAMGALPTKNASLRQLGMIGKILIIDEAHAYDAYVSAELERLLAFHSAQGGSAIVLSATLPIMTKERLAQAFLQSQSAPTLSAVGYPLATVVSASCITETHVSAVRRLSRSITIERSWSLDSALDEIEAAANDGACVCFVRNTVMRAIEAYDELRARGVDVELFHARFAMSDRLDIEQSVLSQFGKASTPEGRRGKVLIATQVVEQSLDIDFDLMVSDLAPVDLLIQRAGRLWRHDREGRSVTTPRLLVLAPEQIGFAAPYDSATLWRSREAIFASPTLHTPGDVRDLVESVYGAAAPAVPENLERAEQLKQSRDGRHRSEAKNNLLRVSDGWIDGHQGWADDVFTPTRLGEPTSTLRLARWDGVELMPYASGEGFESWLMSETSVRRKKCVSRADSGDAALDAACTSLERRWREFGDGAIVLPIIQNNTPAIVPINTETGLAEAAYCPSRGLEI